MKILYAEDLDNSYFEEYLVEDIEVVNQIVKRVRTEGDNAIREFSIKYDDMDLDSYRINSDQIESAYENVDEDQVVYIREAIKNIRDFAKTQMQIFNNVETDEKGYVYGHKVLPLEKVGCYVPGGRYPLPSSALMTVIPAKVAGVNEVVVCSPKIADETIIAANEAGADYIFNLGGAQAIAGMAFGTSSIPRVDKIVGPGNKYVTAAKKRVYGAVGIDFLAGPSEVIVFADETADEQIVAADLLAQAEHDPMARSDLVTTSESLAQQVKKEVGIQLEDLKTKEIAKKSIKEGKIIIVDDLDQGIKIINQRAPEHLELQLQNSDKVQDKLYNYGSLFIGELSAEVFGDYCSGPNHTLPTNRVARYTGGLSVKEYLKIVTYQKLTKESLPELIDISTSLAKIEGLHGHQKAAELRNKFL